MKRLFAALLVLCCLTILLPAALATEPAAEETAEEITEVMTQESAEQTEQTEQPAAEETDSSDQTVVITERDLSVLDGETAIRSMEVTVAMDEAGRATVTQKLEMRIVGEVEELRFSFPDGAKRTQIIGRRSKVERENGVRYLVVSQKEKFTGTQTFELYYTMADVVSEGEESQVLNLPLLSLQDYRIGKYTFAVAMPEAFTTTPRFASGYYNDLVADVMTVRVEDIWVVGAMNEIIRDNDTLTMNMVVPEGYFVGSHGDSSMPTVMNILAMALLLLAVIYWLRTLRNPGLKIRARTLPPDGVNPGDLPFLLSGGTMDFNLLVSHWAIMGYLSIYVSKSGHVILRRRMDMGNERRRMEQKLFAMLFGDGDTCDGASVRYKRVGEKAAQVVGRYWSKRLFVRSSGSPVLARAMCWLACAFSTLVAMDAVAPVKGHGFFLLLALVAGAAMGIMLSKVVGAYYMGDWLQTGVGAASALVLFVLGIVGENALAMIPTIGVTLFIGAQTCHGGMRCEYGDEVIRQTLGFRRFLRHVSEHHVLQMQARDPQYFYKLLPYAEAMGLGKRFVDLFHDCRLESCQWYEAARGVPGTAAAFYDHYCDTLDMLDLSLKK